MQRPESGFTEISAKPVAQFQFCVSTNKLTFQLLRLHRLARVPLNTLAQSGSQRERRSVQNHAQIWVLQSRAPEWQRKGFSKLIYTYIKLVSCEEKQRLSSEIRVPVACKNFPSVHFSVLSLWGGAAPGSPAAGLSLLLAAGWEQSPLWWQLMESGCLLPRFLDLSFLRNSQTNHSHFGL